MFVRKNKNRSGSVSIQIISKQNGKFTVVKTLGAASDAFAIDRLVAQAHAIIGTAGGAQQELFSVKLPEAIQVESVLRSIANSGIHTIGPEKIFGTLFDKIGFNVVPDQLFRHLVVARLAYPSSKLKTVDYLWRYRGEEISVDTVYRFLDVLNEEYKPQVEHAAFNYTKKILKDISVVFYDMTTLYFEAEDEDDLRKIGFSKDGKFQQPQIMIGLLVGKNGYPIGYDIFEGNTFEGHTLLPVLHQIGNKYKLPKPVVIADAGLLSNDNIKSLSKENYKFIIGARLKNESEKVKEELLKRGKRLQDGRFFAVIKNDGTRLIISYSAKRARKDAHNRIRGLNKLQKRIKTGKLTKGNINNRGYNKFLKMNGKIFVEIDTDKVAVDALWDGLKGYATNTQLSPKMIIENYRHLWQIEKAFRISKSDLRVRPIFHRLRRRIEAHICITFVAYTIFKELERLLAKHKVQFSTKYAAELTRNMYEVEYTLPGETIPTKIPLKMDDQQEQLLRICQKR